MEKIYSEHANACEVIQAKKETISLLMQYSRALHYLEYKGIPFETILN
ncbi:hypothetical protein [Robiginitalea sediminis]|nr:hypothetical protein [Robiginitalea sediminis]